MFRLVEKAKKHEGCYIDRILPYTLEKRLVEAPEEYQNAFSDLSVLRFSNVPSTNFWTPCGECIELVDPEVVTT